MTVSCSVDAFPAPTSWTWNFNNSKRSFELGSDAYEVNGVRSSLVHSVSSDLDYGQYHCSATNSEGTTMAPCVVTIIPAQPPAMPTQCSVLNQERGQIFYCSILSKDSWLYTKLLLTRTALIDSKYSTMVSLLRFKEFQSQYASCRLKAIG